MPRTGTRGRHHFQIKGNALLKALIFHQPPGFFQFGKALFELLFDAHHGLMQSRARRHIMRVGIDFQALALQHLFAGQRIEFRYLVDLVSKQGKAPGAVLQMGGPQLDDIAAHPKMSALKREIIAPVMQRHQLCNQRPLTAHGGFVSRFFRARAPRQPQRSASFPYRFPPSRCRICTTPN